MRTVCCSNCCSACGSHFSSVGAFDSHRSGPPSDRYCLEPEDVVDADGRSRLAPRTTSGRCHLSNGPPKVGVTVWTFADALGKAWDGPERYGASA